jgi:leucyl-tRNA synthetase
MSQYNHKEFEAKWSRTWKENKTYKTPDVSEKPKNYTLVMFPYPSGDLHIGHWYNFAPADIFARFNRMNGKNVLNPIGFDAFGLPAENAAIKRGIHPSDWTHQNINSMIKQLEKMGPSYDWDRTVITCDPDYYKWTQWCFLQLYKKGKAYKTKAAVNWCPLCKSVLANEQAEGGICWRCGSQVEQKMIEQWFFKITDYAQRLLDDLKTIDWPEKIKLMQENWIGQSEGAEIKFKVKTENESEHKEITVFTTRPDTLFGATFLVLAPEHPLVEEITTDNQRREVNQYREETSLKSERERISEVKQKTGAFTGSYAIHPITGAELPIWIGDFIIGTYGTGAIMAVPAHDERDYEFAKEFDLPIKYVIQPSEITALIIEKSVEPQLFTELAELNVQVKDFSTWGKLVQLNRENIDQFQTLVRTHLKDGPWYVHTDGVVRTAIFKDKTIPYNTETSSWQEAIDYGLEKKIIKENLDFIFPEEGFTEPYTDNKNGHLVDSQSFSGLTSTDAIELITGYLEKQGIAKKVTKYRMRDWLAARQRYWGAPVPIIYCEKCGMQPVPENQLPVVLPYEVDYTPAEVSPLGSSDSFVNTTCPNCAGPAKRDTDTLDTFVDSSWYFLRYPSSKDDAAPFASAAATQGKSDIVNSWMPVDKYIGGAEHAVLHLLYSRFFTKFFADEGYLKTQEPFQSLFNQGIILGPDHQKMSKSKGNVINPDELVEHYGADAVRLYLCFIGPYDQGGAWNPSGIEGVSRFIRKLHTVLISPTTETEDKDVTVAINKLTKKVTEDIPAMKFNTSVAAFMETINTIGSKALTLDQKNTLILLIAPFCPFISEDIWHTLNSKIDNQSVHRESWPTYNPELLVESVVNIAVQVNGKVRDRIEMPRGATKEEVIQKALSLDTVQKFATNSNIKESFYIQDKLLNIVTN